VAIKKFCLVTNFPLGGRELAFVVPAPSHGHLSNRGNGEERPKTLKSVSLLSHNKHLLNSSFPHYLDVWLVCVRIWNGKKWNLARQAEATVTARRRKYCTGPPFSGGHTVWLASLKTSPNPDDKWSFGRNINEAASWFRRFPVNRLHFVSASRFTTTSGFQFICTLNCWMTNG
jgi:hypothetical protein